MPLDVASAANSSTRPVGESSAAAPLEARILELQDEVRRLEDELAHVQRARLERELEWQAFVGAFRSLPSDAGVPPFTPHVPGHLPVAEAAAATSPPDAQALDLARRSEQLARSLRSLLLIEDVQGLDLIEAGVVRDGAMGPVVFRLLDARGRLAGGLYAERLRLEGSRSGRTLTLVLEDGYESRAGERFPFGHDGAEPFEPGPRRMTLPRVDPTAWVTPLAELFGGGLQEDELDDGRWNLGWVRVQLNELLRKETAGGTWRLREAAGVFGDTLRDVHLEGLDGQGRLERRLFADRLSIQRGERGIVLQLEDGVQVRGDAKAPFLEGRFRIFLPRADVAAWEAASLPGLSQPDERSRR